MYSHTKSKQICALLIANLIFMVLRSVIAGESETEPVKISPQRDETREKLPPFRYTISWASDRGTHLFVPGKWSELHLHLTNALSEPREFLCATYFDLEPTLQFGRKVWVPARSSISVSQPILVPMYEVTKSRALDMHSLLLDTSDGTEVLLKSNQGPLLHDATVLVTPTLRNSAVIGSFHEGVDIPSRDVVELIMACRVAHQLNNKLTTWVDAFLPANERFFNSVDHIILFDDRVADDLATIAALRHWLNEGGRLWVMLDRANPIVLEALFGDDFKGAVIDRTELASVRIDKAPTLADPAGISGETNDFDDPIEHVRIKISDFDVTHTVNGWPAAMNRAYGDGRVFITTLGARAWMRTKPANFIESNDESMRSQMVPSSTMYDLAAEIFSARDADLVPPEMIEPQLREYIGYSIPSWGFVIGSLAGFTIILIAAGVYLTKLARLEYLPVISSVIAVAVSVILVFVGHSYRHGVPGTIAAIQLTEAMAGTDEVRDRGLIGVYHPEGSQSKLRISHGAEIMPDMTGLESSSRRMVTTDLGEAYWDNLKQPPGLRVSSFKQSQTVADRLESRATFDSNGIVGVYSGTFAPGSNALVVTRDGRIGADLKPDGTFVASADNVLERDQFLDTGFMTDEQNRRRLTLQKLLTNPRRKDFPNRPQLMFWSEQTESGVRLDDSLATKGATLVTVPLTFVRPANGTEYVIPSSVLPYRNQTTPDGSPSSSMWNYNRKEWQERSTPSVSWLNFQIPRELLPLRVQRARIKMDVSGPVGRMQVMGLKNGTVTVLETRMDPVGSLTFDIDDPDVLSVSDKGSITLAVNGGDPNRPELTQSPQDVTLENRSGDRGRRKLSDTKVNYWRIEAFGLQIWAKSTE